jgi:hypothetical protein
VVGQWFPGMVVSVTCEGDWWESAIKESQRFITSSK